ncbi:MAG: hypothetical protein EOO38_32050 [Cytophagaceae bacterium]|nr:MAG: hypothetical protein EOO38_32050 [Cytophagaceae bacterium]
MGGLVARAACVDSATAAKVHGVVHVAQPASGAVMGYRRMLTGRMLPMDDENSVAQNRFFKSLFGTSPEAYVTLATGLPSILELMPNQFYPSQANLPWLLTSPQVTTSNVYNIYPLTARPGIVIPSLLMATPGLLGPLLQAQLIAGIKSAQLFHTTLANRCHPNTYVIYGTGVETDTSVDLRSGLTVGRTKDGDGTVPVVSAACTGMAGVKERFAVPGAEHATLFKASGLTPSIGTMKTAEFVTKAML